MSAAVIHMFVVCAKKPLFASVKAAARNPPANPGEGRQSCTVLEYYPRDAKFQRIKNATLPVSV
jgi:hypothetical protein